MKDIPAEQAFIPEVEQPDFLSGLISPLSGKLTSGFYAARGNRFHYGGDIGGEPGTTFVAPTKLTIKNVRNQMSNSPGGMVWGVDEAGRYHKFHHVDPRVKVDDVIEAGSPLGVLSAINGPHLDYKIYDSASQQYVDWTGHYDKWQQNKPDTSAMFAGPGAVAGKRDTSAEKAFTVDATMQGLTPATEAFQPAEKAFAKENILLNAAAQTNVSKEPPKQESFDDLFVNVPNINLPGWAKTGLSAAGKVLAIPHDYIVEPFVERPVNWALKKAGVENIPLPSAGVHEIAPEAAALTQPELFKNTQMTRQQAAQAVGLAADFPVYGAVGRQLGKVGKGIKGIAQSRRINKAEELYNMLGEPKIPMQEAVGATAAKNQEVIQGLSGIGGPVDVGNYTKTPLKLGETGQPLESVLTGASVENQQLINKLSGVAGRELPPMSSSRVNEVFNPGQPIMREAELRGYQPNYPFVPEAEKLTPAKLDLILSGEQNAAQRLIGATEGTPSRLYEGRKLEEFYGGGTRDMVRKYYSGGPDTEDLLTFLKSSREAGVEFKAALTAAAQNFKMNERDVTRILEGVQSGKIPININNVGRKAADETPIVTSTIITNKDSTLGPKGTEVPTIPLTKADVDVRLTGAGDIKNPVVMPYKWTFKTAERLWSEIDDLYPGFRDRFYWPLKGAENKIHNNTLAIHTKLDDFESMLSKGAGDRIGLDQIVKRKTGAERLEKMGIKPVPLTQEEVVVSDQLKTIYKEYLGRVNEARALAGKQPIPESDEYIPFMLKFIEQTGEGINPILGEARSFAAPTETAFRFKNPLTGKTQEVATDAFKIMKNYVAIAEKHIGISPELERLRKFKSGFMLPDGTEIPALLHTAPKVDDAINSIMTAVSGIRPPMTTAERIASKLSNNLVIATLGGYMKSVFAQTGAYVGGAAETGILNMQKGTLKMLQPGKWEEAHNLSSVLQQRRMDIVLEDLWQSQLGGVSSKLKHGAMVPLEVVDDFVATSVWWAAIEKGKDLGLKAKELYRYADQTVIRTQASASPIDRALVQSSRNTLGRIGTAFNTFSIADANYIARNILGIGNQNFSGLEGLKKLVRMTLVGTGMNYLYRDVMGVPTPMPEPFTVAEKALDQGAGPVEAVSRGALELGSKLPVVGSLAFGKVPLGAVGSTLSDVATGAKSIPEAALMFGGVPGTNQLLKLLKTQEGQELQNDFFTALGVTPKPRNPQKELSLKEALLGKNYDEQRKPRKTRQQKWKIDQMID